MYSVLLQMAALIGAGVLWRFVKPLGLAADHLRPALTGLVYVLLLPALVLEVLWQAPLGLDSLRISFVAATGVLVTMALTWLGYHLAHVRPERAGAMILAASFPNVTYLGLPFLEKTLGPWARSVAIQYDLFACLPLVLTLGMLVGHVHGRGSDEESALATLVKVPALWAAILAVVLNTTAVAVPEGLHDLLRMLGAGVVPLMLISLGLGLRLDAVRARAVPVTAPVIVIQLVLVPLFVWPVAERVGLSGAMLDAVVLEAAMPSMVLGVVICDRYRLDTSLYAMVVTATTLLSLISLPLWYRVLGAEFALSPPIP
jgi:predicted permease